MRMRSIVSSLLVVCALSIASARAGVIVVAAAGGGNFGNIAPAVAAASDGDVLLVKSGTYSGFTINNKALAIVADTGAHVVVQEQVRVQNLSLARNVLLVGLDVHPLANAALNALVLLTNSGSVRIQDCTLTGSFTTGLSFPAVVHGVEVVLGDDLAFTRCTLSGGRADYEGGHGLTANWSRIALHTSDLLGSRAGDGGYGYLGGDGAQLTGNIDLFASGCTFRGGNGSASTMWCPWGGAGIATTWVAQLFLQNSQVAAGAYGSCPYPHGAPQAYRFGGTTTVTRVEGRSRALIAPAVTREQNALTFDFTGAPGDQVELVLGDATRFLLRPDLHGVSLVRRRSTGVVVPVGIVAGNGTLSWSMPIGDLGSGVQARVIHAQALFTNVSGDGFLSSPAEIVLLDSAF